MGSKSKSTAHSSHPSTGDHDLPHDQDERPHACYEGVVYIGHLVEHPGTGEEVEVVEAVPCRRCASEARA